MNEGWIKLHRQILHSKTFANPEMLKLWILCLCKANHEENWIHLDGLSDPVKVNPGEFVTGRYSLHRDFYTSNTAEMKSEITLWRWLKKLEKWGNLNIKTNSKYSLVSVKNWDKYQNLKSDEQHNEQEIEQQMNNRRTTDEQQMNTDKNDNNDNNDKKRERAREYEIPTKQQVEDYFKDSDILEADVPLEAEKFINHYADREWKNTSGKRIKNWHRQAGTWVANYKQFNRKRLNNEPEQPIEKARRHINQTERIWD